MTETTKNYGPGEGEGSGSVPDLDLDLDFDLEALAADPPPSSTPPLVPESPPEPEVVIFTRGSVVEAGRPPLADAAGPSMEPPQPASTTPAPDLPHTSHRPHTSYPGKAESSDIDTIFTAPPGDVEPEAVAADTPAPADPFHRTLEVGAGLPAVEETDAGEEVVLKKPRGVGLPGSASSLPPRRGTAVLPRTEESALPPKTRKASTDVRLLSGASPAPEVGTRPTRRRKGRGPAAADEASKSLWGGGTHDAEVADHAPNRRRTEAGGGLVERLKSIPRRWLAIGGAAVAVIVAPLAIPWGGDGDEPTGGSPAQTSAAKGDPSAATKPSEPLDQGEALAALTASTPEARILAEYSELASESARRFFTATTVEEMLAVVRDPERVEPLMREYYSRNPLRPRELLGLTLVAGDDAMVGTKVFWNTKVDLKEGREDLVFEQRKTGARKAFLVDWEMAVNYNPMRWDAFAAERPSNPIAMRVLCTLSTDYRPPFADEARYAAFLLTHPDGAAEVHAYAKRDGEYGRRLIELTENDFEVPVYLNLRFPPDGMASAEILGIIDSMHWLIVE